jgi:hypothetical protein
MAMIPAGTVTKNDYAGEDQQKFTRLTDKTHQVSNSPRHPVPYNFLRDFHDIRMTSIPIND